MKKVHKTVADMIRHYLNPMRVQAKLRRFIGRAHAKSVALIYERIFKEVLG
jgi:hypothetical protein